MSIRSTLTRTEPTLIGKAQLSLMTHSSQGDNATVCRGRMQGRRVRARRVFKRLLYGGRGVVREPWTTMSAGLVLSAAISKPSTLAQSFGALLTI